MDLKPGNVFLGFGGVAKIGDFGLSQLMAAVRQYNAIHTEYIFTWEKAKWAYCEAFVHMHVGSR